VILYVISVLGLVFPARIVLALSASAVLLVKLVMQENKVMLDPEVQRVLL
jgi:hypothetical protein